MKMRKTMRMSGLAVLTAAVALAGGPALADSCSSNASEASYEKTSDTIVGVAKQAGSFNTLLAAAQAAGLAEALGGEGPFTVFAPTDEAFAKLPEGAVESLLEQPDKLRAILKYHVVPGRVMASDVAGLDAAPTLLGQPAPLSTVDGVSIAGAKVVKTDIKASNGVIHVIDSVMMPRNLVELAEASGGFDTLLAAVKAAGLADTLKDGGPFTVFAPTDEAFAQLPDGTLETLLKPENKDQLTAILLYHVVPGAVDSSSVVGIDKAETLQGQALNVAILRDDNDEITGVKVDDASVVATDIGASNGIIHVIDRVVLPAS